MARSTSRRSRPPGCTWTKVASALIRVGADIQLTAAEFRLLRYFMLHPEQILSKSHLAEHLYDGETERDSNVLEVHVNHLRRKLGRSVIETRRGQGYLFGGQAR